MSGKLRALADSWNVTAERVGSRALVGDPSVAMAVSSTLESCAVALHAALEADDSLDAAWAEAAAAKPEGWMGPSLAEQHEADWRAYSARRYSDPPEIVTAVGPTPAAALRALAEELREQS